METETVIVDGKEKQMVIKLEEGDISELFLEDIENAKINLEDTIKVPVGEIVSKIEGDEDNE